MKKQKIKNQRKKLSPRQQDEAAPLIEHLYELRRRAFYCLISVGIFTTAAYFVQQRLVNALVSPAHGQQFIYTSVGGGISFLFKFCLYIGVALSLPLIAYQILRYLEPILKLESKRFIAMTSLTCGILALAGMAFGYYAGLPAALHFLLHQFTTKQIHPLLTIQEYMSFVTVYMFGSALLFQIPLVLLFINRIKPLNPKRLWHYERWVILAAFVISGLMNPTPEIVSQLLLAGPIIVMYQIGILLVWRVNARRTYPVHVQELVAKDSAYREQRKQVAAEGYREPVQPLQLEFKQAAHPKALPRAAPTPIAAAVTPTVQASEPTRPTIQYELPRRSFIMDVRPPMRRVIE